MGNCFGRSTAQKRESNWKATGIVTVRHAGIKSIPSNVVSIAGAIRILDLCNNNIAEINELDLQQFTQLQRLALSGNKLPQLPNSVGNLRQLKHLALDANKLSQLPQQLGQLSRLEQLQLHSNQLVALPQTLSGLKALKTLTLSANQLQQLPAELGDCSSLQELDVSSNSLSSLPAALGALDKLKVLQADNNNISAVPAELLQGCTMLHTLSLHNNPITPTDLESTPGYQQYDARRRAKYDKVIAGGAMMKNSGLDEGVDRLLKPPSPS